MQQEYFSSEALSVRDVMHKLDASAKKIVFLTDADQHLRAAITDGDIRRYLMDGGKLEDPAIRAANKSPRTAHSRTDAQSLYHEKNFVAIPILDSDGRVCDLYLGEAAATKPQLKLPVVINAGGKGTRLDPYTRVLPKPLIPVGEAPIIEHIMQAFTQYGCDDFHMIVNYKKSLIKAFFAEADTRYNVTWYDEEKPLGTGGGLSLLKGKLHSTFVFTNCDTLMLSDYDSILRFHKEHNNVITMVAAYKNIAVPYGSIEMGKDGIIQSMKEKPDLSLLVNTGMYIVEPQVLEDIEDDVAIGFPDIIQRQQQVGQRVAVYPVSENEWLDMGELPELERMRKKLYNE